MTVVTLSASYGAGGSHVGPRLADRLGVAFLDRVIPTTVAERLAVPARRRARPRRRGAQRPRARAHALRAGRAGLLGRGDADRGLDERSFLRATEDVIRERCSEGSGVILGRAAAVVLRDRPGALHVRLDGPPERRLAQAMELDGIDRETAERRMRETDRAREAYVQQFYGVDARDAGLYHLVLDSTALALDACVELIALAAAARAEPRRLMPAAVAAVVLAARAGGGGCGGSGSAPARSLAVHADDRRAGGRAPAAARPPALCGALRARVTGRVGRPDGQRAQRPRAQPLAARPALEPRRLRRRPGPLWAARRRPRRRAPDRHRGAGRGLGGHRRRARPGRRSRCSTSATSATTRRGGAAVDVYRVPEPRVGDGATAPAARLRLRYPDGAHDAEALLVDPLRGDLVIVTKALGSARAYRASARLPAGSRTTLRSGPAIGLSLVTAGDVSADGRIVVLRGYDRVGVGSGAAASA